MTDPGTPQEDSHIQQARALLRQRQPAEAVAVIRRRLAYAPGTAVEYSILGVALAESGDIEHALSALNQAAKMNPGDAAIAYNLGLLYRKAGQNAEAATCFEHALKLRPDYDAARRALESIPSAAPTQPPSGQEVTQQVGQAVTQIPVGLPTGAGPAPEALQ